MTIQIVVFDKCTSMLKETYDLWREKFDSHSQFKDLKPQLLTYKGCWCSVFPSIFTQREFEDVNYEAAMVERKEFKEWHTLNQ